MLDDDNTRLNVAGEFWGDADLNLQLDASQMNIVTAFVDNGLYYPLQGLLTPFTQSLTQDLQTANLPSDYLISVGATIDNQPARLHRGGVGVAYEEYGHYGCMIEGASVVFKGGNGKSGTMWYIRRPKSFAIDPMLDKAEFEDVVYSAILYHAASALLMKDDSSNTRYQKYYRDALTKLLQEPDAMHQVFDDSYVP